MMIRTQHVIAGVMAGMFTVIVILALADKQYGIAIFWFILTGLFLKYAFER